MGTSWPPPQDGWSDEGRNRAVQIMLTVNQAARLMLAGPQPRDVVKGLKFTERESLARSVSALLSWAVRADEELRRPGLWR